MTTPMRHEDVASHVNVVSGEILEAALHVHTRLGPGLLERVYTRCLAHELEKRNLDVAMELAAPVVYDGIHIELGYRLDLLVEGCVVVEVKATRALHPIHFAQLLTYLRITGAPVGILINFHEPHLRDGYHRLAAT